MPRSSTDAMLSKLRILVAGTEDTELQKAFDAFEKSILAPLETRGLGIRVEQHTGL